MPFKPILKPGRNCWRIRSADRVAFLIDGEAYFNALYQALCAAQHEINILSWDIYSDIKLAALQGDRRSLASLLDDLLSHNKNLKINILNWDFAMIFAMDREWLPEYKLGLSSHPRLNFNMDARHPSGGSHHQKLAVIDNYLAFCGGLDITRGRWDTPAHVANDPRRKKVDGTIGRPYHDVQMMASGAVATALNDLVRERWRRATGKGLDKPATSNHTSWPQYIPVDLEQVDVAIVRTLPAYDDYEEVHEVEQLYLDVIASAQSYIYIENQYFTCPKITAALAERLQEKEGPEIIINLPLETEGWLAQNSMDIIRIKLINELRAVDHFRRLAVYYPYKHDSASTPINLHAKIMISDDRFIRVGSSNLNNRSMALDTECDLAVECRPDDERVKKGITAFLYRLICEHMDIEAGQFEHAIRQENSLINAIESHRQNTERTLRPLEEHMEDYSDSTLTESELVDPDHAINLETLMYHFIPKHNTRSTAKRIMSWIAGLVLLLGLAAAWRYTPLSALLDMQKITYTIEVIRSNLLAPFILIATFIVAGLIMIPVTLLIIASILVYGPLLGAAYALISAVACAITAYALGSALGRDIIKNLAGGRISRVSQQLARRGVLTVMIVRIVPVAPFTIINLVAGASHIKLRDFSIGTTLGMIPGVIAIALLTDRVKAALENPQLETILILALLALFIIGTGYALTRYLLRFDNN